MIKEPVNPDPSNHVPIFYKSSETGQLLHVVQTTPSVYKIYALVVDPDGIGIQNTEWTCSGGTLSNATKREVTWEHPGDDKAYTIQASVTDLKYSWQPVANSRATVVINPPDLQKSAGSFASWSLKGIMADGFIKSFSDHGFDNDQDGKFDSLALEVSLNTGNLDNTGTPGYYAISAVIADQSGDYIGMASNVFAGSSNDQTVILWLHGMAVNAHQVAGPYKVYGFTVQKLTEAGIDQIAFDNATYLTAAYSPGDFEASYLSFSGSPGFEGIDENGNSHYDMLKVTATVKADKPGDYFISAQLFDADSNLLGSAMDILHAVNAGLKPVQLYFAGTRIYGNQRNGPFILGGLTVMDKNNQLVSALASAFNTPAYNYLDFEAPFAVFSDNISDRGVDYNGDGLYDSLEVNVGLDLEKSGNYTWIADLYSTDNMVLTSASGSAMLTGGDQSIILRFSGLDISGSQQSGAYHLKSLSLYNNKGDMVSLPEEYRTKTYQYGNFQVPAAKSLGNYQSVKFDNNSNGKADSLRVSLDVGIITPGTYMIDGELRDDAGEVISMNTIRKQFQKGNHPVRLSFDGRDIGTSGSHGPYYLTLRAWDDKGNLIFEEVNVYSTPGYQASDFESLQAVFIRAANEKVMDYDGDTYADSLHIDIELMIHLAGNYYVRAELVDSAGNIIDESENLVALQSGTKSIGLSFIGNAIFKHGSDGPFALANLHLYVIQDDSWTSLEYMDLVHVTEAYTWDQFERSSAWVGSNFGDTGIDSDEDELYDSLRVFLNIEVEQAGSYRLNGQLYDKNGYYIERAEISTGYLTPGIHQVFLDFDGEGYGDMGMPVRISLNS